jgi:hypothetical protein
LWALALAGFGGVPGEVPERAEKVRVVLDRDCHVASADCVAAAFVPPIRRSCVVPVQALHRPGYGAFSGVEDSVIVRSLEAELDAMNVFASEHRDELGDEASAVDVVAKERIRPR